MNQKMRKWRSLFLAAAAASALCSCSNGLEPAAPEQATRTFIVMGTFADVTVFADSSEKAEEALAAAEAVFREIESVLSVFSENSDLSRINSAAGGEPVPVSPLCRKAIESALRHGRLSNGAFDVTVGPLMRLWGFRGGAAPQAAPDDAAIAAAKELVAFERLELTEAGARLAKHGMAVDFGGFAKGMAVDTCCEKLHQRGVSAALVDLGGNIKCLGTAPGGKAWRIGVQNPFKPGELLGVLNMSDGMAAATSGNYERFVEIGNEKYAHIMDPRSGRPVRGMAGVTAVCASAEDADALSTALFVLGVKDGIEALRRYDAKGAIFVPDKQPIEILITPELNKLFEPAPGMAGKIRLIPH